MPTVPRRMLLASLALLVALALPVLARAMSPLEAADLVRQPGRVLLVNARFDVADGPPPPPGDLARSAEELESTRYWIAKYRGPSSAAARAVLDARGAEVLVYVPNQAFLVRIDPAAARALASEPSISWVGPYRPDYKISPGIGTRTFNDPERPVVAGELLLTLSLFAGEDLDRIAAEAFGRGAAVLGLDRRPSAPRLRVRIAAGGERALAGIEGVEWIEEVGEITLRNNTTRWVAQTNSEDNTAVWDQGLHGENQIIGHIDGGIHRESCYFNDPSGAAPGPGHRKLVAYRGPFSSDSHGTHTAGTVAGLHESGSLDHAGIAYRARLSHTRLSQISGYGNGGSNLYSYLEDAHDDGARVHTNSWGDDNFTSYTTWCRDIDRFSRDFEDDLVLFAVTNTSTLKTPENAKNLLAVGATQQAPGQLNIGSGGRGPTADGRRKPEIFLPGIGVVSSGTSSCNVFSNSGTSMAAPAVAGCATLVRQYYEEGFYPTGVARDEDAFLPTAALVKATLLNATVDLAGASGYPSDREGWGRLRLLKGLAFPGSARGVVVKDVRHASGLSTGQLDEVQVEANPGLSLEVTLVFTDQPAALGAALTPVNDLDLEVQGPDGIFLGNVFAAASSAPGGAPDPLNNVERVILPAGAFDPGVWTIRIRGKSVPDGPQGYALHVSGDVEEIQGATDAGIASYLPSIEDHRLAQNEPNPFSETTSIRFSLPERNEVRLGVFDIAGRRVQSLADGSLLPGDYTVHWDGRDFRGEKVAAGIYFYRLEGGGFDETRKLILIR